MLLDITSSTPILHVIHALSASVLLPSLWIMSRVSVSPREIVLTDNKVLKFWVEDECKVFGIPCGRHKIKGRDANINPEAIQFIKGTVEMNKTGVHSLRAAEEFLLRDINENSSQLEKDCFQIAFVIFCHGPSAFSVMYQLLSNTRISLINATHLHRHDLLFSASGFPEQPHAISCIHFDTLSSRRLASSYRTLF